MVPCHVSFILNKSMGPISKFLEKTLCEKIHWICWINIFIKNKGLLEKIFFVGKKFSWNIFFCQEGLCQRKKVHHVHQEKKSRRKVHRKHF